MTEKYILNVQKRDLAIKGKKYRQDGFVLGNISGHGDSQALILPFKETRNLLNQIGESSVFYLHFNDGSQDIPALLQETQLDPINGQIIHIAMKKVNLKEKVRATVEFVISGELAVHDALTILAHQDVEVEALPADLPAEFVLDISKFTTIGEQITYKDLDFDRSKVTLLVEDEEEPILVVSEVKEEVEETSNSEDAATDTASNNTASESTEKTAA